MNKVILIGRITKDVELKYTPGSGKAVTNITLACDKFVNGEKQADFIPVVVWDKNAENLANFQGKGSKIAVYGRLQTRSYDDKNGEKRFVTEIVASEIEFLDKKKEGAAAPGKTGTGTSAFTGFNDMVEVEDGDIPF